MRLTSETILCDCRSVEMEGRLAEMNQFFKNVTIAGGFLMLTAFGPGNLSVDARGNRGSHVAA